MDHWQVRQGQVQAVAPALPQRRQNRRQKRWWTELLLLPRVLELVPPQNPTNLPLAAPLAWVRVVEPGQRRRVLEIVVVVQGQQQEAEHVVVPVELLLLLAVVQLLVEHRYPRHNIVSVHMHRPQNA